MNRLEGMNIIAGTNSEMWHPIGLEASLAVCKHRPYLQEGIWVDGERWQWHCQP